MLCEVDAHRLVDLVVRRVTATFCPAVPDSLTSCLRLRQVGCRPAWCPGSSCTGSTSLVAGEARRQDLCTTGCGEVRPAEDLDQSRCGRSRSSTACRAFTLLNGGMFVFIGRYQNAVSGFTCTWSAYLRAELGQAGRPAGRRTSSRPGRSATAVTCGLDGQAERHGRSDVGVARPAARRFDHSLKYGLRFMTQLLVRVVRREVCRRRCPAGASCRRPSTGCSAGRIVACGTASL